MAEGDLTQAALVRVRELVGAKNRVSERPVPADDPAAVEAAEAEAASAASEEPEPEAEAEVPAPPAKRKRGRPRAQ